MALRGQRLDGGAAAEVRLEVGGDGGRDGDVARGLHDDAGRLHHAEHAAEVRLEDALADVEGDVRPHVEERPAELLHRRGHVGAHRQRRVPRRPRLVVCRHRVEHLLDLRHLEPAVVVAVVQEPVPTSNRCVQLIPLWTRKKGLLVLSKSVCGVERIYGT